MHIILLCLIHVGLSEEACSISCQQEEDPQSCIARCSLEEGIPRTYDNEPGESLKPSSPKTGEFAICLETCLQLCERVKAKDKCQLYCSENFCAAPISTFKKLNVPSEYSWTSILIGLIIILWVLHILAVRLLKPSFKRYFKKKLRSSPTLADYVALTNEL